MAGEGADQRRSRTSARGSVLHSPCQTPARAFGLPFPLQPPGCEGPLGLLRPPGRQHACGRDRVRRTDGFGAPQDQHQGGREGQQAIDARGHGLAGRMAVGRTQHMPAALPGPALGHELLAGIDREALSALDGRLPDVAAGPDAPDPPDGAFDQPHRQCATFQWQGPAQIGLQNRQRPPTNPDLPWRVRVHSGKLPPNPCASAPLHE